MVTGWRPARSPVVDPDEYGMERGRRDLGDPLTAFGQVGVRDVDALTSRACGAICTALTPPPPQSTTRPQALAARSVEEAGAVFEKAEVEWCRPWLQTPGHR